MLSRKLPTPEECERLEASGWAPSRLGAGWWVRGESEPCWWTWVLDCSWVSAISARLDRPIAAHSAAAFISARQFCRSARLCTLWRLVRELLVFRGAYYSLGFRF